MRHGDVIRTNTIFNRRLQQLICTYKVTILIKRLSVRLICDTFNMTI